MDLQKNIVRASTIARLDGIIRDLEASGGVPAPQERAWFADLLYPVSESDAPGVRRLTASPHVSRELGSALLTVLVTQFRTESEGLSKLITQMDAISVLRTKLQNMEPLEPHVIALAIDVARRLRKHFIGVRMPKPVRAGLA